MTARLLAVTVMRAVLETLKACLLPVMVVMVMRAVLESLMARLLPVKVSTISVQDDRCI